MSASDSSDWKMAGPGFYPNWPAEDQFSATRHFEKKIMLQLKTT